MRVAWLVLGAVAMILAPCLPALASTTRCTMSGCDDNGRSRVSAATCCCATNGTPANTSSSTTPAQAPVKLAHAIVSTGPEASAQTAIVVHTAMVEPAVHVPIFLLNTSLLM